MKRMREEASEFVSYVVKQKQTKKKFSALDKIVHISSLLAVSYYWLGLTYLSYLIQYISLFPVARISGIYWSLLSSHFRIPLQWLSKFQNCIMAAYPGARSEKSINDDSEITCPISTKFRRLWFHGTP